MNTDLLTRTAEVANMCSGYLAEIDLLVARSHEPYADLLSTATNNALNAVVALYQATRRAQANREENMREAMELEVFNFATA